MFIMRYLGINKSIGMLCLSGLLFFSSCHSAYQLAGIQSNSVEINSEYDTKQDNAAVAVFAPYKAKVDSIMSPVIGTCEVDMTSGRPESLLSNLVADVLREYANTLPGQKADLAVINFGGLRSNLPKGNITFGTIYEILPFENSLCLVSLKGTDLISLFSDIAKVGGQGVSNVNLLISAPSNAELIDATVGGEKIDKDKIYTVATIDYLAEGNDGLGSFLKAEKRVCPEGAVLRHIVLDYVKKKTVKSEVITSRLDGRIQIKK